MPKITLVPCYTCGELTENNGFEPICDDCQNIGNDLEDIMEK